jgi:hypothetical protein
LLVENEGLLFKIEYIEKETEFDEISIEIN